MIKVEKVKEKFFRHYSDEGKAIRHKTYNLVCANAIESEDNRDAYEEVEEEATGEDLKEALKSLGVVFDV